MAASVVSFIDATGSTTVASIPNSDFVNPELSNRATSSDLLPLVGKSFKIQRALSLAAVRLDFKSSDNLFTTNAWSVYPLNHVMVCVKKW